MTPLNALYAVPKVRDKGTRLLVALLLFAACGTPAVEKTTIDVATDVRPREPVYESPADYAAPTTTERPKPRVSRSRTPNSGAVKSAPSRLPEASVWHALAQCESGGRWHINTGNGYYGGLQFSLSSWRWVGGTGYPHEASVATQIEMGRRLQARQGWGAWPACSRKLGLR